MITTRQLRYFDALATTLHFGRAAELCAVTQPALSMQIRDLERELGVVLVERTPGEVALTAEGREIAHRAAAILADIQDLATYARRRHGTLAGSLRLGIIPSIAPYLLPALLPRLQARYPDLDLQVRETQTAALIEDLLRGDLDCVLIALPWSHPQIETRALFDDEFLLAVSAADATLWPAPPDPESIADQRLLLLEEGHCLRDQVLQFCRIAPPGVRRSLGATSLATSIQMVAAGYGVTLLPRLCAATEVKDARITLLPFADPAPKRQIGLAWRRTSGRARDFETLGAIVAEDHPEP